MGFPFWRNMSAVLLALEAFILALVPLAVLYYGNKGLLRLRALLPPVFPRIRARVEQVEKVSAQTSEVVVAPIIAVYAFMARMQRTAMAIVGLPKGGLRR